MCYNYISYIVSVWSFIRSQLLDEIQDVHLHLDVFRIVGDKEKRDTSFLWKEMTEQVQVNRLDVMANLVWGESQDPCWASENLACVVGNLSRCGEVFMGTILNWWQMGDWGPVGRYFELVANGRLRASDKIMGQGSGERPTLPFPLHRIFVVELGCMVPGELTCNVSCWLDTSWSSVKTIFCSNCVISSPSRFSKSCTKQDK